MKEEDLSRSCDAHIERSSILLACLCRSCSCIGQRSGSAWVQVGTEGAGAYTDGWHKLRLEVTGTTVNGYVDGNLEVSATDTEYTQGTAGMVLYEANDINYLGAFDNFYWDDSPTAGIDTWTLY